MVPIENSIEGSVGITLDLLAHDYNLKIKKEILLPISNNLLINSDAEMGDIRIIYSHSQALSQCRKFIEGLKADIHSTSSTSAAAELIIGKKSSAAVGTKRAAQLNNLKIAARKIQDYKNNYTRFVVISKEDNPMIRIVSIGDFDDCPCIGEHVKNTKDIENFRITSTSYENGVFKVRFKV